MLEKYLEMIKELRNLGECILNKEEYNDEILEEIECMNMHLECGLDLLGKAIG